LIAKSTTMTSKKNDIIRIALIGSANGAKAAYDVYSRTEGAKVTAVCAAAAELKTNLEPFGDAAVYSNLEDALAGAQFDAIEFCDGTAGAEKQISLAALAGKHLAARKPFSSNLAEAKTIAKIIKDAKVKFFVIDEAACHPFVEKAKKIIDGGEIGEVQSVRVKSHCGPASIPAAAFQKSAALGSMLDLPPFEKVSIVERLLGRIEDVYAYEGFSSVMVSYKFESESRYGVHEAVVSKDMNASNGGGPAEDHVLEITGTDGILWLRNLSSLMIEAPKLCVKRKDVVKSYDYSAQSDFEILRTETRAKFVKLISGAEKRPDSTDEALRSALVNEAARLSVSACKAVKVSSLA